MATFPTTLPAPLLEGYSFAPQSQVIRTDMESGPARVRRRSYARLYKVAASWIFTDAQFNAFREWFYDGSTGAGGGSIWFGIELAIGGSTRTSTTSARFIGDFTAALETGGRWKVTAQLEAR